MNITQGLKKFALTATIALLAAPSFAQTTATTDPVGFVTYSLSGNADSYVYVGFKANPAFAGATSGSVTTNVVAMTGAAWAVNQFAPGASGQPKFYALIRSGNKSGMWYTITANDATTITLDLAGDSIASDVVAGTTLQVCAFDTVNTLFAAGVGINASTSFAAAARQSEILVPDTTTAGTNLAVAASYYYYSGAASGGPGWRKVGSPIATIFNDTVLYPDTYFIVRHNVATATSLTTMGTVHLGTIKLPLTTLAAATNQDIPVGIQIPGSLTLAQTTLFESGAFLGSATFSAASRGDEVFVWDNTIAPTKNKAPDATYYYYTGAASGGPGWRKVGSPIATIVNSDVVIQPGKAIRIRKKNTGAPSTVFWTLNTPY